MTETSQTLCIALTIVLMSAVDLSKRHAIDLRGTLWSNLPILSRTCLQVSRLGQTVNAAIELALRVHNQTSILTVSRLTFSAATASDLLTTSVGRVNSILLASMIKSLWTDATLVVAVLRTMRCSCALSR